MPTGSFFHLCINISSTSTPQSFNFSVWKKDFNFPTFSPHYPFWKILPENAWNMGCFNRFNVSTTTTNLFSSFYSGFCAAPLRFQKTIVESALRLDRTRAVSMPNILGKQDSYGPHDSPAFHAVFSCCCFQISPAFFSADWKLTSLDLISWMG